MANVITAEACVGIQIDPKQFLGTRPLSISTKVMMQACWAPGVLLDAPEQTGHPWGQIPDRAKVELHLLVLSPFPSPSASAQRLSLQAR